MGDGPGSRPKRGDALPDEVEGHGPDGAPRRTRFPEPRWWFEGDDAGGPGWIVAKLVVIAVPLALWWAFDVPLLAVAIPAAVILIAVAERRLSFRRRY